MRILFPQSRVYKSMHSYSAHGPDWSTAGEIISLFAAMQAADPYFHYIDMNQDGMHDYNDSDAFDKRFAFCLLCKWCIASYGVRDGMHDFSAHALYD